MARLRTSAVVLIVASLTLLLAAAGAAAAGRRQSHHRTRCSPSGRAAHTHAARCRARTPVGRRRRVVTKMKAKRKTSSRTPTLPSAASFGGLVVGLNADVSGWGGASTAPRMSQVTSQTGTKWLREEFLWSKIEPTQGTFDFSRYDNFMQVAAQAGEHILVVFDGTPSWAGATYNTIPSDPTAYATALAALVKRYGPHGSFWTQNATLTADPISTYELVNEPYYSSGDNGDYNPGRYANLVKAATTAGRAADPTTRYLLSAETTGQQVGTTWINWIDALYHAVPDLNNYFDAVAIHPYGKDVTGLSGIGDNQLRRTELIRRLFVNHGASSKPLWITEIGWPTCTSGSQRCTNAAGQAASLEQLIAYLHTTWSTYVQAAFLYHYQDLGTDLTNSEDNYGLTTTTSQSKPVLSIFQALAATSA
jgi:hypothetical protein